MKDVAANRRAARRQSINILDACGDPHLFAPWFKDVETWQPWFTFLAAAFGLPMSPDQFALYRECTGRMKPPANALNEAWLICGRRSGKSFILALIATFLATFRDYRAYLAPGERGVVVVIASDRKQARTIMRYIGALLRDVPMLARQIERETAESFDLTNRVSIEVMTASFRRVRGYTIVAALLDELAFWPTDDSANPDVEVINAIRPAMATIPNAMLLCASSPHARKGALWQAFERHYGKDMPVLVWKAATRTMNSTVPQSVIDEAVERDPAFAAAEYGGHFRVDVETYISREAVMACVDRNVNERPHDRNISYVSFCDPSGGGADSFCLSIAHKTADTITVDAVREVRPVDGGVFNPEAIVSEYAGLLRAYRIGTVVGDRYAGSWPAAMFRKFGIDFQVSDKNKSEIYLAALPLFHSQAVALLDSDRLIRQLVSLERHAGRGGRDTVDHPRDSHDDLVNAVAGSLVLAQQNAIFLNYVPEANEPVPILSPLAEFDGDGRTPRRSADEQYMVEIDDPLKDF